EAVARARDEMRRETGRRVPILVKVSPDETLERLDAIADAALAGGADGFIATNTTVSRPSVESHPSGAEAGGLSGAPVRDLAERACARLYLRVGKRLPIIGVGGITSADDAYRRIRAGASLVQIYTALVYGGPSVVRVIHDGLANLLERDGLTLAGAVGTDADSYELRDRTPARTPSGT
ncbi:MAG TPA: dihydroorotate dehydrogenase (quinone), partial [Myxococcales bacterium]|nr:dihydroorotate dehydrogenase (quinone) [Myxococcales bacterium]